MKKHTHFPGALFQWFVEPLIARTSQPLSLAHTPERRATPTEDGVAYLPAHLYTACCRRPPYVPPPLPDRTDKWVKSVTRSSRDRCTGSVGRSLLVPLLLDRSALKAFAVHHPRCGLNSTRKTELNRVFASFLSFNFIFFYNGRPRAAAATAAPVLRPRPVGGWVAFVWASW